MKQRIKGALGTIGRALDRAYRSVWWYIFWSAWCAFFGLRHAANIERYEEAGDMGWWWFFTIFWFPIIVFYTYPAWLSARARKRTASYIEGYMDGSVAAYRNLRAEDERDKEELASNPDEYR